VVLGGLRSGALHDSDFVVLMYCFVFLSPTFFTTILNEGIYIYHRFCSIVQNNYIPTLIPISQHTSHNACIPSTLLIHESAELLGTRNCFTVLPVPPPSLVLCFSLVGRRRSSFFFVGAHLDRKNDEGIDSQQISIWISPLLQKKFVYRKNQRSAP